MKDTLYGVSVSVSDREYVSVRINDGYIYLKISNINLKSIETRHEKSNSVSDSEILKDFEDLFKEHNQIVSDVKNRIRKETIDDIKSYCGMHTEDERREQYTNQIHKGIFDIRLQNYSVRFMLKTLFIIDEHSPILFDITDSEFEELKKLYTTF